MHGKSATNHGIYWYVLHASMSASQPVTSREAAAEPEGGAVRRAEKAAHYQSCISQSQELSHCEAL